MKDNTAIINIKLSNIIKDINEDLIPMAIDEVTQAILNYCNIKTVPDELRYVHANMVYDLVNYYYSKGVGIKEGTDVDVVTTEGEVTSISLGDMKIGLGSISGTTSTNKDSNAHTNAIDDIVLNYTEQLNQFREMYG